jgi:hypothetical protein
MGSLQTEIQKTLNSWGTVQQPANTSIAGKVFDFVQNNPSCTSNAVVQATGIDLGRASATLLTLYQKGKLDRKPYPNPNPEGKRDTIYHYWTSVDNFTDRGEKRVAKKPKKDKALSKVAVPVIDLETPVYQPTRMRQFAQPEFTPEPMPFDADAFVATLNVHDAKKIYNLLKKIFG